ncbi:MAG: MBL fold metallo-hydrolase [Promethearchaeota archaeon]
MEEVYPGIYLIKEKVKFESIKPSENIYIITGNDGLIFDAGYGNKKMVKFLVRKIHEIQDYYKEIGKAFNLSRILPSHTHPDHFSGLKKIREYLGVKIILTRQMAEVIKNKRAYSHAYDIKIEDDYFSVEKSFRHKINNWLRKFFSYLIYNRLYKISFVSDPDITIEPDSTIIINGEEWNIFSSPGHSGDHISLYNEEKGILFSGDNVLSSITTWLGPPNGSIERYMDSIKKIQQLPNLNLILPAHGKPIMDPKKRIADILEHRTERTQQILDIITQNSGKGISPTNLLIELYPNEGRIIHQMAKGWINLTLKMLEKEGQIRKIKNTNRFTLKEENN